MSNFIMWLVVAALNLAIAVILGAFGAHGLKSFATSEQIAWWHTATDYFFYHALGMLALAILVKCTPHFPIKMSFFFLQIGILIFCGSLYLMALGLPKFLGAITPIGGLMFILGWLTLAWKAYQHP